jgi:hypothetical protein
MRRSSLLLPLVFLAVACGGGGGGTSTPQVLGIQTSTVDPMGMDYRAVFDCTATVSVSTNPASLGLTGTYTVENTGNVISYAPDRGRQGMEVLNTLVLDIPAVVRTQYPQLPPTVTLSFTDYVEVAQDGTWYSLGQETTDTYSGNGTTYRTWAAAPIKIMEPELFPGQSFSNPAVDMLSDDLSTVVATRQLTRSTAAGSEILNTPLGALQCYVTTQTETVTPQTGDTTPYTAVFLRWERPDYGLLRLEIDEFSVDVVYEEQPLTVTLRDVVCVLRSLSR